MPGRIRGFGRISEIFNAFHAFRVNHFICATYYTLREVGGEKCVSHFIARCSAQGNNIHCTAIISERGEVKTRFSHHVFVILFTSTRFGIATFLYATFSSLIDLCESQHGGRHNWNSPDRTFRRNKYVWAHYLLKS